MHSSLLRFGIVRCSNSSMKRRRPRRPCLLDKSCCSCSGLLILGNNQHCMTCIPSFGHQHCLYMFRLHKSRKTFFLHLPGRLHYSNYSTHSHLQKKPCLCHSWHMSRLFCKLNGTSQYNTLFPLQHFCTKMDHFYMQRVHNKHLHLALSSKHTVSCNHQDTVHYHATRSKIPSRHHSCCRHHQINLHPHRMHWYMDPRGDPIVSYPYSFPI